ncbi:hypothetical protein M3Y98_00595800 [Aphelenchoides besseyi]|nr:hypothetical protein M3Y98_00595800 [Aphelenchoides besseyi]KAI6194021.1 hypothetical protein M3Y96_01080800 [Aphelenchoides besseyi]
MDFNPIQQVAVPTASVHSNFTHTEDSQQRSLYVQPMNRSHLETTSLTTSMWTSSLISADSNVSSDIAFYRRASWLEEYGTKKLLSIENRSAIKQAAKSKRTIFGTFLTFCLPCSGNKKRRLGQDGRSVVFSSQTSLTSMLEKAEEEHTSRGDHNESRYIGLSTERPSQRVLMITSSL